MMIDPALALAILLAGMYSFWMGGNDMANSVAPLVGGGVLDFKKLQFYSLYLWCLELLSKDIWLSKHLAKE
jgi:hypothetical protein